MRGGARSGGRFGAGAWPRPTPGAQRLAVALTVLTALAVWSPRAVVQWLVVGPSTLPDLHLTALLTNALVAPPAPIFRLLIFVALFAFMFQREVIAAWHRDRNRMAVAAAGALGALWLVNLFVLPGCGWGWAASAIAILWFVTAVEIRWGMRRTLIFCGVVGLAPSLTVALLAWLVPGSVLPLLGSQPALPDVPADMITGVLTAWCLLNGRARLAFLNIEARQAVWVLVGLGVMDMILFSVMMGMASLAAIAAAWMLVTGLWRPRHLTDRLRLLFIDRRLARRRARMRSGGGRFNRMGVTP